MKSIIHFGEGNTGGTIIPLVPFNCIVDTDFGLLTYIDREYLDKRIFSVDFFDSHHKIVDMVKALYYREYQNPLLICMKDKTDLDMANALYNDFMKEKYKEILSVSVTTEIYNLLELFKLSGEIKPTIVYKNDLELKLLNSLQVTKSIQKININEIDNVDMYQQFFFKSFDDIYYGTLSTRINTKSVYIGLYEFNLSKDNEKELSDLSTILYLNRNKVYTIDFYDKNKLKGDS